VHHLSGNFQVQQSTKIDPIVNLKTAKALDLDVALQEMRGSD
jgi:hypothetical protein